jgi:short-subunit dehydrogenase
MPSTLITGASSGLGVEFARLAAANGDDLVLVARSVEKLDLLADELRTAHGVKVTVLPYDLSSPASVDAIVRDLSAAGIVVHTLIANAGVGRLGAFAEQSPDDASNMLRLNVESLTMLIRALLPGMIERKAGRILTVASIAAFTPGPLMAVYFASKAYVLHFSVALRNELRGSGVTVTCLCPGPTKTGFQKTANMMDAPMFKKAHIMDAASVSNVGYDGMLKGKAIVVPGLSNKLTALLTRLAPKTFTAKIARAAQESS